MCVFVSTRVCMGREAVGRYVLLKYVVCRLVNKLKKVQIKKGSLSGDLAILENFVKNLQQILQKH